MSQPFSTHYAQAYDALYREKDYAGECDLLERVFARHARGKVRTLLDLGCGTGNHALPLAQRGYEVVGVDRAPAMLEQARSKAAGLTCDVPPEFREGDVRSLSLGRTFDAATLMFAVLGYQATNAHVLATLRGIATHLRPGGLLVFDVWYGPAVLNDPPTARTKVSQVEGGEVVRETTPTLDPRAHTCLIAFRTRRMAGEQVLEESEEQHLVRYFFPLELELFLETAGLELVELSSFPDPARPLDLQTWNALVVARKGAV